MDKTVAREITRNINTIARIKDNDIYINRSTDLSIYLRNETNSEEK
jgi:hypothetical protein